MASGCALVSTDNLGVHEYGSHGQNCFIGNKDEDLLGHLYELIENPDLVDRLGAQGRETALNFDWSIIADKWADHLRDIYSKSGFTKYA
jgi:glycosyltransferase involved in cell wall biosynthesis